MPFEPIFSPVFTSPFGAGFNPAAVFAAGDVGFVYDTQNLASMFQDVAGTVPANQPGHPVGLRLDTKHGLGLGPELVAPLNFASGWTNSGAVVTVDADNAFTATAVANFFRPVFTVGKTYRVTINANFTGAAFNLYNANNGTNAITPSGLTNGVTQSFTFLALSTELNFRQSTAGSVTINSLTVAELPGIHATQSVAASRPTLARRPASGVRNLLTYTEDFTNGAWVKTRANVVANAGVAPDGTMTADQMVEDTSATTDHRFSMAFTPVIGADYTFSVYAKAAQRSQIVLYESASGAVRNVLFDLSAGTATPLTGTGLSPSIVPVGNGWYRCSISVPAVTTAGVLAYMTTASGGTPFYTGDGASSIYVWGAQLELGLTATAYQRVRSVYDVTEAGQPDRWCLVTDGVDDGMVTPTITPAVGADKVQVVAGVRKLSDAAVGVVVELSTSAAQPGSWYVAAPASAAAKDYTFQSRGSAAGVAQSATMLAPHTAVITGLGDIAGDSAILRVNGAQVAASAADQGAGQYGNYPVYLYRRGGTTLPAKIEDYGMICRISTTNLSAAQIGQLEAWANQRTGAY